VTCQRRRLCEPRRSDDDRSDVLGSKASLLLSIGFLTWGAASVLLGPIWLAMRGHGAFEADGSWDTR
jgi:hypothetical protein